MSKLAICIGAQKAGTSWVFHCLREHPDIAAYPTKESHFFSTHYDAADFITYLDQFPEQGQVRFEASTSYLADPAVPHRLKIHCPDVRLIVILRDPVERAFSHYLHLKSSHRITTESILEAAQKFPDIIGNGLYGQHLTQYLAQLPQTQLLVIDFSDLETAPQSVIDRICDHIEITRFVPTILNQKYHSAEARQHRYYRLIRRIYLILNASTLGKGLIKVLRTCGLTSHRLDHTLAKSSAPKPQLTSTEREWLKTQFADDQVHLQRLIAKTIQNQN